MAVTISSVNRSLPNYFSYTVSGTPDPLKQYVIRSPFTATGQPAGAHLFVTTGVQDTLAGFAASAAASLASSYSSLSVSVTPSGPNYVIKFTDSLGALTGAGDAFFTADDFIIDNHVVGPTTSTAQVSNPSGSLYPNSFSFKISGGIDPTSSYNIIGNIFVAYVKNNANEIDTNLTTNTVSGATLLEVAQKLASSISCVDIPGISASAVTSGADVLFTITVPPSLIVCEMADTFQFNTIGRVIPTEGNYKPVNNWFATVSFTSIDGKYIAEGTEISHEKRKELVPFDAVKFHQLDDPNFDPKNVIQHECPMNNTEQLNFRTGVDTFKSNF